MEDMGRLPTDVNFEVLKNKEDDLGLSLFKNTASIHTNCRARINEQKQQRAKLDQMETETSIYETPKQPKKASDINTRN